MNDINNLIQTWESLFDRMRADIDTLKSTLVDLENELETERKVHDSILLRVEMMTYAITGIQGRLGHPWISKPAQEVRRDVNAKQRSATESDLLG